MCGLKQRNNVFRSNCKAATICNVCKFKCNQNMHANKPLMLIYSLFTNIRSVCISDHFWIWKTITEAKIGKHLPSVHTAHSRWVWTQSDSQVKRKTCDLIWRTSLLCTTRCPKMVSQMKLDPFDLSTAPRNLPALYSSGVL